MYKLTAEISGF